MGRWGVGPSAEEGTGRVALAAVAAGEAAALVAERAGAAERAATGAVTSGEVVAAAVTAGLERLGDQAGGRD